MSYSVVCVLNIVNKHSYKKGCQKENCLVFIWLYKSCDTIVIMINVAMISVIDYSAFDPFF